MNQRKAFTLIELIIVISIIVILFSLSLFFVSRSRSQGKDLKVLSNISQFQIALDNYNISEGSYPEFLDLDNFALVGHEAQLLFSFIPKHINSSDYRYNEVDNTYELEFYLENAVDNLKAGAKCAIPGKILEGACCFHPVLDGEGNSYPVVRIGEQCWMAKSLNLGEMMCSSYSGSSTCSESPSDNGVIEKYCYLNLEESCNIFGGLYRWDEAMNYTDNPQGICPDGWRIANDQDWHVLESYLKNSGQDCDPIRGGSFSCFPAGNRLKIDLPESNPYWSGSNTSGFSAYPGGVFDGYNFSDQSLTAFWSLGYYFGDIVPYYRLLKYNDDRVYRCKFPDPYALAIRCIKDYE